MRKQAGFTLVELVVVIAVLGILAATALPRFINVNAKARAATVSGLAAGMRSAVGVVQAAWQANGGSGASVTMADSTVVTVGANGIPTGNATGIGAAAQLDDKILSITYATSPSLTTVHPSGGGQNCQASYNDLTGTVTTDISSC